MKMKRSKAAWRRHCIRTATKAFFKLLEIGVVVVYICRIIVELPDDVKNSGKYLKDWVPLFVSPRFMFFVGNAIIITLFLQSGYKLRPDHGENAITDAIYQAFVERSRSRQRVQRNELNSIGEQKMIMNGEKESISENMEIQCIDDQAASEKSRLTNAKQSREKQSTGRRKVKKSANDRRAKQNSGDDVKRPKQIEKKDRLNLVDRGEQNIDDETKKPSTPEIEVYRRSQSENLIQVNASCSNPELHRATTERFDKGLYQEGRIAVISYPEDRMSSEEFRDKVEAFIARQRKQQQEGDDGAA